VACSDEQESHYADVATARQAGLLDRGWIPDILPPDAVDIREVHDLDTNVTWGCFNTATGVATVRSRLAALQGKRVSGPVAPGMVRVRSWWPSSLTGQSGEVHEFQENGRFGVRVGIDATANRVCFFRGLR
jgi:hypothetical protein